MCRIGDAGVPGMDGPMESLIVIVVIVLVVWFGLKVLEWWNER